MSLFFQNINFSGNFNTDSNGPPPIRCIVATSAETVNEGGSISFVIYTQNVPTGATTLYWAVEPSGATNVDFAANTVPTGTISVSSNFGTASGIVIRSDLLTEPAEESFVIAVYTDSNRTMLAGRSRPVIINDTSQNPPGQTEFTIPGTYTWVAPFGFSSASAVTVGAGGNGGSTGGGGGALSWGNITLTGGASYTVVVGAVGQSNTAIGASGGFSSISLAGANIIYAGGGYGAQVANNRGMGGNVRILEAEPVLEDIQATVVMLKHLVDYLETAAVAVLVAEPDMKVKVVAG